jgi:hypothetical protein
VAAPSRFWAGLLLAAGALFAALSLWMRAQQAAAVDHAARAPDVRPLAEVATALRAMKLVTVEIDTSVTVERRDASWRGDVAARVTVPVRLSYGTDLSAITAEGVAFSPVGGAYVVRVPPPQRIATEVFGEKEKIEVEAGGLRLRSRAGEYYLGLARQGTSEAARELVLLEDDARRVREVTRQQVERLIRSIVGDRALVRVLFSEGPP